MPDKKYQSALDWLFEQFPSYQLIGSKAYKPTLENISSICRQLGDPQDRLKFIHIAGTNGKGSCSSMIASILTESGYKVGLFTSPHIRDFRERIRVNGVMIPEKDVLEFIQRIQKMDLNFSPSFFEITFALALIYFEKENCDICVIETGLGGRLDATNIIVPELSLITNISLEHTAILGNTLEEIAVEKAGIIKEKVPVVISEIRPETEEVFKRISKLRRAPLYSADELIDESTVKHYNLPLLGSYQLKNFKAVLAVLNILNPELKGISPKTIQKGLDHVYENSGLAGRMQVISKEPLIILDVSHNEAGILPTLATVKGMNKGKLFLLYGSSSDKDVRSILEQFPKDAEIHLTTFQGQRSLSVDQLSALRQEVLPTAILHSEPQDALEFIKKRADKQDTILVFGSFFLVSDLTKKR